jgi:polyisoprenoid-binding protein YceI
VTIPPGTHRLGPGNATLAVHTKRTGAAAKAGHDLVMHVTSWEATLELAEEPERTSMELDADATSLRVQKGTGGIQALGDDEKASIHQTIDDEVLKRHDITFRSSEVRNRADGVLGVAGDLTIVNTTRSVEFDLSVGGDGTLGATAVVRQSEWGMKPYSALFGTLKVHDDVEVVLDGRL